MIDSTQKLSACTAFQHLKGKRRYVALMSKSVMECHGIRAMLRESGGAPFLSVSNKNRNFQHLNPGDKYSNGWVTVEFLKRGKVSGSVRITTHAKNATLKIS